MHLHDLALALTAGLTGLVLGYVLASPVLPLSGEDRRYCEEIRRRQQREAMDRVIQDLRRGVRRAA